ncbi:acyl carrier protein [Vibrio sp. 10N.261.46.A3]|uniref:acyl carrier protein n=1 Tax=Vibrio sp. 10N.261.46.A3 TaxID=3229658 RepID=UPI00354DD566
MTQANQQEVYNQVKDALIELFELDAEDITPEAHLYLDLDLDLDSIDAVDLVVHLQNVTGKKIKPEEFKAVRTVNDVVESVVELLKDA